MRKLEEEGRLRQASDAVVTYLRGHRISRYWGEGLFASSNMRRSSPRRTSSAPNMAFYRLAKLTSTVSA